MTGSEVIKRADKWVKDPELEGDKESLVRGFMMGVFSLTGKEYWKDMFEFRIKEIALEAMNLGMGLRQHQLQGSDERSGNEVFEEWYKELNV